LTDLFSQLKTNDTPQIHCQIAVDQNFLGHYQSAVEQYQITLAIAPDSLEGLNNLAWLLATCSDAGVRDGKRAVELAQHACQLTGEKKTVVLGTLAAAYAEAGRFDEAIATAQKACASATAKGETELLAVNQKLLAQYQQHQPYHEAAEKLVPGAP
jgi:tetratricopeptide (TPR) repeat protein